MPTNVSEKQLETILVDFLRDVHQYEQGVSDDYSKDYALDTARVKRFLIATQKKKVDNTACFASEISERKFFTELSKQLANRGVTDVLRKGFRYISELFDMYYPLPSELNPTAQELYRKNIFCVTRQLFYSKENQNSIDVMISLNGLPLMTLELKNHYTGQTIENAVKQYQIKNNIVAFKRLQNLVAWADSAEALRNHLASGKKIIITIVHKFPYILEAIGGELKHKRFGIIIDEAHSSQNGSLSTKMNIALSGNAGDDDMDLEDRLAAIIEGRKMVTNANYYAFTATPKNKTLQMFGTPFTQPDGEIGHRPFHEYTMKQAIEEGFIMDVLEHYTTYTSLYKIVKAISEDPLFDKKEAQKKLRAFVEGQPETIQQKAAIIVEHFHTQVIDKGKVGGQARAMVVTSSILRAIEFYYEIKRLLEERKSPYKAIVAFSGSKNYGGKDVTEADVNGFPSKDIEENMEHDPYLQEDETFVNAAKNSNKETAMQQCASSLMMIVASMLNENTEFCRYYLDHPDFMNAVNLRVFDAVYNQLSKLQNVEDDKDVRDLIYNRLQMDSTISNYDLQREVMELFGERYGGMKPKDWAHIIEEYTPMVREAAQPKAREISMHQYGMAAESGTDDWF